MTQGQVGRLRLELPGLAAAGSTANTGSSTPSAAGRLALKS